MTQVATSTTPAGTPARLAFTSAAELVARHPEAALAAVDVNRICQEALTEPYVGLVINPAGPWIALDADDLRELQRRLPAPEPQP